MSSLLRRALFPVAIVVAAAALGAVLMPRAHAEGLTAADGQVIVIARFIDRCDGSIDVAVPNPYRTGNLLVEVDKVLIVVGPKQTHRQTVPPRNRANRVVRLAFPGATSTSDRTIHEWHRPAGCPAEQTGSA